MFRKGWRTRLSLLRTATFEDAAATYVAFGQGKAGFPVYRHDRSRRILVPTTLTYPSCFEFIPTALMTSRLKRRRLKSILEEYGPITEDPGPGAVEEGWRRGLSSDRTGRGTASTPLPLMTS